MILAGDLSLPGYKFALFCISDRNARNRLFPPYDKDLRLYSPGLAAHPPGTGTINTKLSAP